MALTNCLTCSGTGLTSAGVDCIQCSGYGTVVKAFAEDESYGQPGYSGFDSKSVFPLPQTQDGNPAVEPTEAEQAEASARFQEEIARHEWLTQPAPGECSVCATRASMTIGVVDEPDMVNHPPHYADTVPGVECIDVARHFNFNRGNAIKYVWRAGAKGDEVEDLRKAVWYLNDEIARLEADRGTR